MSSRKQSAPSPETQAEAIRIAKATQKVGQTKEQTRLVAQGIQKGIEQYKKQQKAKAREQDKLKKKVSRSKASNEADTPSETITTETVIYKHNKLAWGLLIASWVGFAVYLLLPPIQ
ncbi:MULTISPECIES: DUF2956 domain-containing protein [unclassified Photobacterium]|uniref:DUF2956 domain-containing protein n=1 Tax=unclassified Photobacterium TaxID=2628852 RepID=UPI001EDDB577|nr:MULTISPECIES: DUF2956 domain-containing protein [unclassified Photobacterium]MCG3862458.1 DUF2956 domain-containing protein [Photobacterium sp. Ph6]MCG3874043.1 DUF2956 domain-containing protein [Photobacterium sp. Ph5]